MKQTIGIAISLCCLLLFGCSPEAPPASNMPSKAVAGVRQTSQSIAAEGPVTLLFSPEDNIEAPWMEHIRAASRSIHIACFGLSNKDIARALEDAAQNRHIEVIVLEDRRQSAIRSDLHEELASAGCHIIIKRSEVLLHDKFGVFDGSRAILGSWNLSQSAEAEDNSTVIIDHAPAEAADAEAAWELMFRREVGEPYKFGMALPPVFDEVAGKGRGERVRAERMVTASSNSSERTETAPSNPAGKVWVNTRSGKYFVAGSRYYGKTKEGEYLPEQQAIQSGYQRAHGG